MTTPFMRAYTELLVKTCHRRGAFAMGGMAAFIPNRKDAAVTTAALQRVREDKERESRDGFDGTWVAHPDLVPVAAEVFERALAGKPNQATRQRPEVHVTAKQLLDFTVAGAKATEAGLRNNVEVGIRYLESWLRGNGAVAIHNLMEDAATAEISRSQVWLWVRQGVFDAASVRRIVDEEVAKMQAEGLPKLAEARTLFERVSLAADFPEFLTLPAYEHFE
jgi:malate synthase